MPSITVSALSNGITLDSGETVLGVLPILGVSPTAYIYYTSLNKVYYQTAAGTAATLVTTLAFAITCSSASYSDGSVCTLFFGGSSGSYAHGTVDGTGVGTITVYTSGTVSFSAATFDVMNWGFIVGDTFGNIYTVGLADGAVTLARTLTPKSLPSGATLIVSSITFDVVVNAYLIVCKASTNVSEQSSANYSEVFFSKISGAATLADTTFTSTSFVGRNLRFGAIGQVESVSGVKVPKYVIAGEDIKIFNSLDGVSWVAATSIDQAIQINALVFNTWVFVAGLAYGVVLLSTNGSVWESAYDGLLTSDIVDVKSA